MIRVPAYLERIILLFSECLSADFDEFTALFMSRLDFSMPINFGFGKRESCVGELKLWDEVCGFISRADGE